jgi:hypothetical protein
MIEAPPLVVGEPLAVTVMPAGAVAVTVTTPALLSTRLMRSDAVPPPPCAAVSVALGSSIVWLPRTVIVSVIGIVSSRRRHPQPTP